MTVLDLFSGAGGFSLGFSLAGCRIIGAVEADLWASETYLHNFPTAKVLVDDITTISNRSIVRAFPERPDIILGGPPCQGYSICRKNPGDPKDPRNSLFIEYLRIVKLLRPRLLVMENVPNIINAQTRDGQSVISIIQDELSQLGYSVYHRVLTASDYGVPQRRQRLFVIGSQAPLADPFPKATHRIHTANELPLFGNLMLCPTLWDAISDLPSIEAREGAEVMDYDRSPVNDYQLWCRDGSDKVYNHLAMKHSQRLIDRFSVMKWGESVSDVKDARIMQRKRNGNGALSDNPYDQNNRRQHPDKVCSTITATFYGNFVHPYKNRNFTAREGARIQSFPDWFRFYGKPTVPSKKLLCREGRESDSHLCQYSQIGNAVPPLMAKSIAENLLKQLNKED